MFCFVLILFGLVCSVWVFCLLDGQFFISLHAQTYRYTYTHLYGLTQVQIHTDILTQTQAHLDIQREGVRGVRKREREKDRERQREREREREADRQTDRQRGRDRETER